VYYDLKNTLAANAQGVIPIANNNNYPSTVVEGEQVHDVEATTGFTADAGIVSAAPARPIGIDDVLFRSSSTNFQQDIATFLRKPVILSAGTLSTTDTTSSIIYQGNLPFDMVNVSTLYREKIRGFLGLRATMKIRIQVNGNRMQQGRYMLCYLPTCGSGNTGKEATVVNARFNTRVQRSQLFNVQLDVNCDTEAHMSIPYLSSMNYVPTYYLPGGSGAGGYGQLGVLRLYAYSPLISPGGSTTCAYTIWAHFEDVELIGPAVPQSGSVFKKGKGPSERESEAAEIGPIGATLTKISDASALLAKVPLISDYASGVSWFTNILAGSANVFGWSKPANLSPNHIVKRTLLGGFCNVDSSDNSNVLSVSQQNMVGVLPGFSGTDIDEMDFSFLKTIPAWQATLGWSTTDGSGVNIFSYLTSCNGTVTRTLPSTRVVLDFVPFQFIANYFTYWRGSLVFTIKFVKTEFHSGRLCFSFYPSETYSNTFPVRTLAETPFLHREIVDIRMCNEVTFTVPFLSSSPWRPIRGIGNFTGWFDCWVLDPLVAPANVSGSIQLILEVAAGPDFEVAVPFPNTVGPVLGVTPQSGNVFGKPKPQTDVCELVEGTLGGASASMNIGVNAMATIGESVTSFRALLKMTDILGNIDPVLNVPNPYVNILPFASAAISAGLAVDITPRTTCDLYGALCGCYVLSRGGVRLKIIPSPNNNSKVTVSYITPFNSSAASVGDMVLFASSNANGRSDYSDRIHNVQVYDNVSQNKCIEFQVPQYHFWHSRVNSIHMVNSALPATFGGTSLMTKFSVSTRFSDNATTPVVCRSGSEDTNFGVFCCIPPMAYLGGTTTE